MMAVGFQMVMSVTRHFDMAIRWSVSVENAMTTVQRLMQYIDVPQERSDGLRSSQVSIKGNIDCKQVEMRYQETLAPALQNLNFNILPGEKIAVVGRTGAGKSSLYQLLLGFRTPT